MSDEMWRRRGRSSDETSEFGGPLFPDDPADDASEREPDDADDERRLRFGPNDTGPLPHWTDPPTGEVPRLDPQKLPSDQDDDDIDVWSSFTTETPVWRDDPLEPPPPPAADADADADAVDRAARDRSGGVPRDRSGGIPRDRSGGIPRDRSGGIPRDPSGSVPRGSGAAVAHDPTGEVSLPDEPRREAGRITIGTDPAGTPRHPPGPQPRRRSGQQRSGRPAGPARTTAAPASTRNLPAAIGAAVVLAGLFIAATLWKPVGVLAIVVAVLGIAGFEYFGKVTEKGYRPAVAAGLAACVAAPLAAYWQGERTLPLVLAFAFIAGAVGFVGAQGVESGPLPNMAVTTMGAVWIGLLGSYAALIVRWSNEAGGNDIGTDTLFLVVLGVVANDIGALVVGSAIGRTPLRSWISPAKTVEGLLGGAAFTILTLFVVGVLDRSDTWSNTTHLLLLGVVIAVMAPLGDLTESMFKRNLDVKDFGAVLSGHGGVLDRFDSFLFALPAAYYLALVLEPWTG